MRTTLLAMRPVLSGAGVPCARASQKMSTQIISDLMMTDKQKNPVFNVALIAAHSANRGIGMDGQLPWGSLHVDMQRFKKMTASTEDSNKLNAVIMGKNTWISIPPRFRPLRNRLNLVVSSTLVADAVPPDVCLVTSIQQAIHVLHSKYQNKIESVFIIGGQQLYTAALDLRLPSKLFITRLGKSFPCDTFLPEIPKDYKLVSISESYAENGIPFDFVIFQKLDAASETTSECNAGQTTSERSMRDLNFLPAFRSAADVRKHSCLQDVSFRGHAEFQYLDAIVDILNSGSKADDRTGVGVLSMFGRQMRFSLRETFPLLTTKRVFWKGVVGELLWFIKGDTNEKNLSKNGIKIWESNASREFLDSVGLTKNREGDLGPIYGFQWRHFGADYIDCDTDYTGQGVDQLKMCIEMLKRDPNSRRIIFTAWNPVAQPKMALAPCHTFCQFYVMNGELSCLMYQRSCDMGLGVPFNIASYSLLTCMIAQVCGLKRGEFVYTLGNYHVYLNHIEALKVQLRRDPRPFPILKLDETIENIDDFLESHIQLLHYNPHGKIQMKMAV